MSDQMRVVPKKNGAGEPAYVLDPKSRRPLPAEGAIVRRDAYWLRRLAEGCVEEAAELRPEPQAEAKGASKASTKTERKADADAQKDESR